MSIGVHQTDSLWNTPSSKRRTAVPEISQKRRRPSFYSRRKPSVFILRCYYLNKDIRRNKVMDCETRAGGCRPHWGHQMEEVLVEVGTGHPRSSMRNWVSL